MARRESDYHRQRAALKIAHDQLNEMAARSRRWTMQQQIDFQAVWLMHEPKRARLHLDESEIRRTEARLDEVARHIEDRNDRKLAERPERIGTCLPQRPKQNSD